MYVIHILHMFTHGLLISPIFNNVYLLLNYFTYFLTDRPSERYPGFRRRHRIFGQKRLPDSLSHSAGTSLMVQNQLRRMIGNCFFDQKKLIPNHSFSSLLQCDQTRLNARVWATSSQPRIEQIARRGYTLDFVDINALSGKNHFPTICLTPLATSSLAKTPTARS